MFDFMAICEECGRRDMGRTWGTGTSPCESCYHPAESPHAKYCEPCANRKNACKFCGTSLSAEYERITPSAPPAVVFMGVGVLILLAVWFLVEIVSH